MNPADDLLSTFERIRAALLGSTPDALMDLVAEDFTGIGPCGEKQDREMMLEAYRPGAVELVRFELSEVNCRVLSKGGLLMGTGEIEGRFGKHSFCHHLRFLDVYRKQASGWRLWVS